MAPEKRPDSYNYTFSQLSWLPAGNRVLFLGQNHAKNALLAGKLGLHVEVLDAHSEALMAIQQDADKEGVFLITRHTRIEHWHLTHAYDAIVLGTLELPSSKHTYLFEKILSSLAPKGLLIGEVIGEGKQIRNGETPPEPYDLITLYGLFQSLPCRILKISKELIEEGDAKGGKEAYYLLRMVVQKA
jgi:hypothetical protein